MVNCKFSIIIPFNKPSAYLRQCLEHLHKQPYKPFEVIVLPDKKEVFETQVKVIPTGPCGPAEKRDIGANAATGDILAFIDDDAHPNSNWLQNALRYFNDGHIAAVGGPGVTPPGVSWQEEASGWTLASPMGSGGFGYRFIPQKQRYVDDYPSMNLLVRKKDFLAVGGFDSQYWPGEDTKLCLDLVYILKKRILYVPDVVVYHHRRPLWIPHLRQQGNYGLHRGYFARTLPKTSARLVYCIPSALFLGVSAWLSIHIAQYFSVVLAAGILQMAALLEFALALYCILLVTNAMWILWRSHSLTHALVSIPAVFITHLWYGIRFIQGFFFTKQLRR